MIKKLPKQDLIIFHAVIEWLAKPLERGKDRVVKTWGLRVERIKLVVLE